MRLDEETDGDLTLRIPWATLRGIAGYVLIAGISAAVVMTTHEVQEDNAYASGYRDGRNSCTEPSRAEKAVGGVLRYLSRPGE